MGQLDCVVIGYNDTPFEEYEKLLHQYGEDSEAYRDLKYSYVDWEGKKFNYVNLLNHAYGEARGNGRTEEVFKSGEMPNLGAAYLTNFLKRRGFEARYVNLFQHEKEKLIHYLEQDPYCVAITTTFYVLNRPVIEIVNFIREYNEKVKIVVGGPLVANHFNRYEHDQMLFALEDMGADIYVVESQGELTLSAIVNCLKRGADLSSVPNIFYHKNGSLEMTQRIPENNSLDENYVNWQNFPEEKLGASIQVRTARSCAFSCSFCAYPIRAGQLTLANLDTVERELDSIRALGHVKNVIFIDDTFNVPLKRFKEICNLMIEKNYGFDWFSYFRCSNSDEEAIELMARSGCKGVFLGIESGSPTILKNMHKAAKIEQYVQGAKWLRDHGIFTFGSFITGFPGETEETVDETIDFLKEVRLDYYRTQLWYCEPGTPIYDKREEYKILGQGFKWEHDTMNSLEAMDYIDKTFIEVGDTSTWLPIWSFDFWFIPYVMGKGVSRSQFTDIVTEANKMMRPNIIPVPEREKQAVKTSAYQNILQTMSQLDIG